MIIVLVVLLISVISSRNLMFLFLLLLINSIANWHRIGSLVIISFSVGFMRWAWRSDTIFYLTLSWLRNEVLLNEPVEYLVRNLVLSNS